MPNRLINIFSEEIKLYSELLGLLQEEKSLLTSRTGDELYRLARRIETVVFKVKAVYKMREGVRREVAKELGARVPASSTEEVSIVAIARACKEPHSTRLLELESNLLSLAGSIKELNHENGIVVGRGMENIKTAFLFLKDLSAAETYRATGQMCNTPLKRA